MATSELHEVILMQTEFIALNKSLSSPTGNNPPPRGGGTRTTHTYTHSLSPKSTKTVDSQPHYTWFLYCQIIYAVTGECRQ